MWRRLFALLFSMTTLCVAQEVKPSIEKISDSQYRIGLITFDPKTRELRFPCEVNMAEGLLEFLIVHQKGKVHESLLKTAASPLHLQLALTLLRYKPSKELRLQPDDTFPEVAEDIKKAARLGIDLEWNDDGRVRRVPANEWIQHTSKASAMPATHWVFAEADAAEGNFTPETTGDLAAIYLTNSALIAFPGTDNRDDTVWMPFPKRVPPVGTPVTVILYPDPASP